MTQPNSSIFLLTLYRCSSASSATTFIQSGTYIAPIQENYPGVLKTQAQQKITVLGEKRM